VLIYLVIRIVWTFQQHELFSVGLYILPNKMNRRSISGNNTEQVLQLQITDLQDNLVVTGTNLSVGGDWLAQNTTANNTAMGYQTADNNTAVGCQALTLSTTGYLNTGVGTYSMYYLTKGINNTAIGFSRPGVAQ